MLGEDVLDLLALGRRVVVAQAPVYARSDITSFNWAYLPRGAWVTALREVECFMQVQYVEPDRWPDPTYNTMEITGWVRAEHLTCQVRRYFYWFEFTGDSAITWTQFTDNHEFTLLWANPAQLDDIAPPQDAWVGRLLVALNERY